MLLQLIGSTYYSHGEYIQGLFPFVIMKKGGGGGGGGGATKVVIRNVKLGT